jgi:hypothetical protein
MPQKWPWLAGPVLLCATALGPAHAAGTVNVAVDARVVHQTWHGFGATHESLVYGGTGDVLSVSQRQRAVDALFAQVKISTGGAFDLLLPGALVTNFNPKAVLIDVNDDGQCEPGEPGFVTASPISGPTTVLVTPALLMPVAGCTYVNSFPRF